MQNTVCFLEIPTSLFSGLIRQILLEEIKKFNSLLVQVGKLSLWNTGLARCNIPVHAFYENLNDLVTGVRNMWQAVQRCPALGSINSSVDELNLVHTSTYWLQSGMYKYILVHTSTYLLPLER